MAPSKQEIRLEKKKKKVAALANLTGLHEEDIAAGTSEPGCSQIPSVCDTEPEHKRPKMDEKTTVSRKEYRKLKKALEEKKKQLKSVPKIKLKTQGEVASLDVRACDRIPIFLEDIQHLLMQSVFGKESPRTPWRWCTLEKHQQVTQTVVLVIEGIYLYHYSAYQETFSETKKIFHTKLETVMPPYQEGRIVEEFASVPLTMSQRELLIRQYGSLEEALEAMQDPILMLKSIFPIEQTIPLEGSRVEKNKLPPEDVFSRTKLLLSPLQMIDEGYPLPLRGELATKCQDYLLTKDKYAEVTAQSPIFGLDCEMCKTNLGYNELTRISIVNEMYESVYETLVMPPNPIVDYLTPYSGITAEMMKEARKTVPDVQREIRELLPADAILVGQSLNVDLNAMGMMHPYVIDTSIIYNLTGDKRFKSKLQVLAREFLGEKIQENPEGHDSVEDSVATVKLVKLKLSKGMEFGDVALTKKRENRHKDKSFEQLLAEIEGTSLEKSLQKGRKELPALIVSSTATKANYEQYIASKRITQDGGKTDEECGKISCYQKKNNKAAIAKTCANIMDSAFAMTHVKLDSSQLTDERLPDTLARVDKWIGMIWKAMAYNGLFVVVMGGSPISSSGASFMEVKKLSRADKLEKLEKLPKK
ncbi:uncharacterized protein DMENIID0001_082340 [Sergentomyia squamirostris]